MTTADRIAELEAIVARWARHQRLCRVNFGHECTCGLFDAKRKAGL